MATKASASTLHLNERTDADRAVLVTTADEDRFSLPCAQAVEACKVHISREVWFDELESMFARVREWCEQHKDRVRACHAAARGGVVVVFVVPHSTQYDRDLGSLLTDLDIELAQQYQVIESEVLQVPGDTPERLATFVQPGAAKTIYG